MKITKIDLLHARPVEGNWRPTFCRVYTDKGVYGDGEVALSFGVADNAAFGMLQDMGKLIIGMDPLENEVIWDRLYRSCFWGVNGGPVVFGAISAFDMACWDIRGKTFGVPVYKLLGGKKRNRLRTYASQIQNGIADDRRSMGSPEDYAAVTRKAMDMGFDAVKINFTTFRADGSRTTPDDKAPYLSREFLALIEDRIRAVRETLGPIGDLILENHCYTDKQSAVQMGNMAKKYGIMYFEEPTAPHSDLLSYVHRMTGIPVATGERMYTRWQYKERLDAEAVQVIQPDIGTCGGITEVKKICDMAQTYDASVQIHTCGSPLLTAASLQMEAVISGFIIHEYNVNCELPCMHALARYDYQPVGGYFDVPELPGLGNEISEHAFRTAEIVTIDGNGAFMLV